MGRGILTVLFLFAMMGRGSAACVGDCNTDAEVTVDELILGVNIALGTSSVDQCHSFDADGDGEVAINELIAGVNSALVGCSISVEGDYSGEITFGTRHGSLTLSVDARGKAGGALLVESTGVTARASQVVTFPAGSFAVTLIGTANAADGTFEVSGTFTDGDGQSTEISISGTLPVSAAAVPITARIGTETFSGTLSTGTPTPGPTPAGPTPTPVASCADGSFSVTFSDVSSDSNVNPAPLGLGKGIALDSAVGGGHLWVISGKPCREGNGEPVRSFSINVSDAATGIVPGTYAIKLQNPPFIRVNYAETKFIPGSSQNYAHQWLSTDGTLVVTDAGGGALNFHASGVTMGKGPTFPGALGTFTLDISGTVSKVTHN
ncbi:MAG: hypothetical protein HY270_03635 [Deltaproteobacteria bacterium]|nr:hypothetical protein [Deltaproteobacteria bacterium]